MSRFVIFSSLLGLLFIACQKEETSVEEAGLAAPQIPEQLQVSNITNSSLKLSWKAAADSLLIKRYLVYQNEVQVSYDSLPFYNATGLAAETEYTYSVRAINFIDDISDFAQDVVAKTRAIQEDTVVEVQEERVLVFTKTESFRHNSIPTGISTITNLGAAHNFEVDQTEEATAFNATTLAQYGVVVFLNTTGDVLNATQQAAFENYMASGGSFMGIHSAADTEYDWPWYGQLMGAYFNGHPAIQNASIDVVEAAHSSTAHLESTWQLRDEWYNYRDIYSGINVLLNLDESSYQGGTNGENHPIAWYHEFGGGRAFYTGLGHREGLYNEPDFQQHLLGGILYCLGRE